MSFDDSYDLEEFQNIYESQFDINRSKSDIRLDKSAIADYEILERIAETSKTRTDFSVGKKGYWSYKHREEIDAETTFYTRASEKMLEKGLKEVESVEKVNKDYYRLEETFLALETDFANSVPIYVLDSSAYVDLYLPSDRQISSNRFD